MKTRTLYLLIATALIAILSLVGYYFTFTYIAGLSMKTNQANADLLYIEAKYQQTLSQRAVASTGENAGKKLDKYILAEGGEVEVVKELERLASELSLFIVTETLEVEADESLKALGKEYLHIVEDVTGSEGQVRRFLGLIESLPYNVRVNEVNLFRKTTAQGLAWEGRFDFSIVKNLATQPQ
jgi:hypothetical protein